MGGMHSLLPTVYTVLPMNTDTHTGWGTSVFEVQINEDEGQKMVVTAWTAAAAAAVELCTPSNFSKLHQQQRKGYYERSLISLTAFIKIRQQKRRV